MRRGKKRFMHVERTHTPPGMVCILEGYLYQFFALCTFDSLIFIFVVLTLLMGSPRIL